MSKILAIDDKLDNLVTLSALLRNLMPECTMVTAQSGREGIEKAKAELPDVILLDVKMPDMDGFETCRRLMSDETTQHIPVIMITAIKTDPKSRIEGLECGANTFLAKPIDEYELVSQVRVALRIKKAEDGLREERNSLEEKVRERTAALQKSEERYHSLFDNMIEGFALHEIICDSDGRPEDYRFLSVNSAFERLTGLDAATITGKRVLEVMPDTEPSWIEKYGKVALTGEAIHFESYSTSLGRHYQVTAYQTASAQFACIFEDITDRKHAEEQIKASLSEKEILLKEIHHRVKNNMQVISSLLNMQSRYLTDTKAIDIFLASMDRIRSMSLIHNHLYRSESLSRIDVRDYIRDLSGSLLNTYSVDTLVELNTDITPLSLTIDTVLPLGLLVNELLTNALKHAFPGERTGLINIGLKSEGTQLTLTVSDNGIGIPPDLDHMDTQSMGMQLIVTLVEQLEGTIELNRDKGTEFKVTFEAV